MFIRHMKERQQSTARSYSRLGCTKYPFIYKIQNASVDGHIQSNFRLRSKFVNGPDPKILSYILICQLQLTSNRAQSSHSST